MPTLWYRRLFTQTLAFQLGTLSLVLLVAGFVFARRTQDNLLSQNGERALAVAETVAAMPVVRDNVADPDSPDVLQPLAELVRRTTGVDFVVITDMNGIRRSHPDPERIGQRVSTDPTRALQGFSDVYVQVGTLGQSVRGKVPIWGDDGDVVGIVSVGVLIQTVSEAFGGELVAVLLTSGAAMSLGAVGAWLLARRIRRQTLNLQPDEIASLYEHREATLQGIREGVVGLDSARRVNLLNREAARLLDIGDENLGDEFTAVVHSPAMESLIHEPSPESDVIVALGSRILVVNVMPVVIRGKRIGSVITLRDRTELDGLLGELDSVRGLVDALRVQAHEFANTLHTISGLLELGNVDEAVSYIGDVAASHQQLTGSARNEIGDNLVLALLLAKSSLAAERGIEMRVDATALEDVAAIHARELVTIIGNLVDNAFDSVAARRTSGGRVDVRLTSWQRDLIIRIADNGEGIDPQLAREIFTEGFTTKSRRIHSGIGLSLVTEAVERLGGTIDVTGGHGAVFEIVVPGVLADEHRVATA